MTTLQKGKKETINDIRNRVRAGYPVLYLYTTEELKAMEIISEVAEGIDVQDIFTFDVGDGLKLWSCKSADYRKQDMDKRDKLNDALKYILENIKTRSFIVFKDIHQLFQADPHITRSFKNFLNEISMMKKQIYVFIVSPTLYIPPEIEKEIVLIDIPLPTKKEIEETLTKYAKDKNISIDGILKGRFIEALNGLTETEVINIIGFCHVGDNVLNEKAIDIIVAQKQQLIKKDGTLEFVNLRETFDEIGGLGNLKDWIEKKKKIFDQYEKAMDYGVDVPKGVLFYGMPGCGKSIAAKAIATKFEMPLLRLDMGRILGPYLGQSEENIRKAIKIAESIAPSVLWIDELEKAFVGVGEGQGRGSETTTRIFGSILTWMQEKTKPVFVVATANDISGMPPEFMRKGRFDEVFFIEFPEPIETIEIFKKHLNKRLEKSMEKGIDGEMKKRFTKKEVEILISEIEFDTIAATMKEYSGADIEAIVKEINEDAFISNANAKDITTKTFTDKLNDFNPSSKSMGKKIKELRDKAKEYDSKKASKTKKGG